MSQRIIPLGLIALLAVGCGSSTENGSAAGDGSFAVTGTDSLEFEPSTLSAAAGEVTVELTAEPGVGHTFVIEGVNDDQPVVSAGAGETATGAVELAAGDYTAYCSIPGHREAGMEASLDVTA